MKKRKYKYRGEVIRKKKTSRNVKRLKFLLETEAITIKELAHIIGIDRVTIKYILEGRLPGLRIAAALHAWDPELKPLRWFHNLKRMLPYDVRHYRL